MGRPAYLILHGYESSGPGHWQTWLGGRLRAGEENVRYPDLPDPEAPQLRSWLDSLAGELDMLTEPPVVICHSLACLLWLHHVDGGGKPARRVLFVAPPSEAGAPDELAPFFPAPHPVIEHTRLVCSDNDPYCPEGALALYGRPLGLETDVFPGAGHINPETGFGAWPAVEAWAREGTVPLTAPEPARG